LASAFLLPLASANGTQAFPHFYGALAPDSRGLKSPKRGKSPLCRQLKLTAIEPKLKLTAIEPKLKLTAIEPKLKLTATEPKLKLTATEPQ